MKPITVKQYTELLKQIGQDQYKEDHIIWFICVQSARLLYDCTTRDNASLFKDGIEPYTLENIQERWLDTLYEDSENVSEQEYQDVYDDLVQSITSFYK